MTEETRRLLWPLQTDEEISDHWKIFCELRGKKI